MTPGDRAAVRSWVGAKPVDSNIEERFARLGTIEATALEILRARRADFLADPLNRTLVGDLSVDGSNNVKALDADIARLELLVASAARGLADSEVSIGNLVRPDRERGAPLSCPPFPLGI